MGMGFGTSILLIAVGAILDFAVKVQTKGFNLNKIGLILLIVGIVGLVLSVVFWKSWGGVGGYRRTSSVRTRATVDGSGRRIDPQNTEYVEEEQRY
jgi:hypothetical protein